MNYKVELVKRVFKKLGREIKGTERKPKTIQLSSDISMHDFEVRKRRAIEFLKSTNTLKFFMKVNVYDPENIKKGRLMLLNVAEDLKEFAKIKVHPGGAKAKTPKNGSGDDSELSKHMSAESLESVAHQQNFVKMSRALINADEGASDDDDDEDPSKQYIYMELESTQGLLADIDIDAMFNSTSVDEFMNQISRRGTFSGTENLPKSKQAEDAFEMITQMVSGKDRAEEEAKTKLKLNFNEEAEQTTSEDTDKLRTTAMTNLRNRRMRLK